METFIFKIIIGVAIIAAISSVIGVFAFLRKKALVGDAIAHALYPGICIGFMVTGQKDPYWLFVGALMSGLVSIWMIDWITKRTKLSSDTAIASVSTFLFAIGAILFGRITLVSNGNQAGLRDYLFGKVAALTQQDIYLFFGVGSIIGLIFLFYYERFKLLAFNQEFAQSLGFNTKWIEFILSFSTVIAVAVGLQAVGVVLMSALLIAPAAIARFWTDRLSTIIGFSIIIGVIAAISGVFISESFEDMPTGPWIITFLFCFLVVTLFFAPQKGWIAQINRRRANRNQINAENLLKLFYQSEERGQHQLSLLELIEKRTFDTKELEHLIKRLKFKRYLSLHHGNYALTDKGRKEGARIVRLHRLWELYLTQRLNFQEDHIHGTAETIEHLITPELEEQLLKDLNFPEFDPHQRKIPY